MALVPKIVLGKECTKCGEFKTPDEYHTREGGRLRSHCKTCTRESNRNYQMTPEQKERRKETYLKHSRYKLYGLTKENFESMLNQQSYQCKICGTGIGNSCHVDHCHKTGKVRGLLCRNCNTGIGMLKDDPKIVAQALRYLNEAVGL